jgi:hypothetical protein
MINVLVVMTLSVLSAWLVTCRAPVIDDHRAFIVVLLGALFAIAQTSISKFVVRNHICS